jgi:hypothetical protein
MKKQLLIAILGLGLAATVAPAQQTEEAQVRAAVQNYLNAHATGDGKHLVGVFNPRGHMYWSNADTLAARAFPDYITAFRGQPAPDEAQRKREIKFVDVTGRAAIAKVELDYPTGRITDYLSLVKLNGAWHVINKTFYSEPKAK